MLFIFANLSEQQKFYDGELFQNYSSSVCTRELLEGKNLRPIYDVIKC